LNEEIIDDMMYDVSMKVEGWVYKRINKVISECQSEKDDLHEFMNCKNYSTNNNNFRENKFRFKCYDAKNLYSILEGEFYFKKNIEGGFNDLYKSFHTFKSHLDKCENQIDTYKFSNKLKRYNFYDVVQVLEFQIDDNLLQNQMVTFKDYENLTTGQLSEILNITKQTVQNLKVDGIFKSTKISNKNIYNLYDILNTYRVTKS